MLLLVGMAAAWGQASSVLAGGDWWRVAVQGTGVYRLTAADVPGLEGANVETIGLYGGSGEMLSLDNNKTYIGDLQPVARGTSGRLYKMKIVGEKRTQIIGKELAIRYALSETALYSSAFVVERHDIDADGYPAKFVIRGAGWGHGVGLCQIGAAVMGAQGYDYKKILLHYFVGAQIEKQY